MDSKGDFMIVLLHNHVVHGMILSDLIKTNSYFYYRCFILTLRLQVIKYLILEHCLQDVVISKDYFGL